ncbi:MAG: hypothetical protein ABI782_09255 [Anaerolineaceae bacterium]
MNTFFASAGRTTANVLDGAIDGTTNACIATGHAGVSFAAGWKAQRRLNAMKRGGARVLRIKQVRA